MLMKKITVIFLIFSTVMHGWEKGVIKRKNGREIPFILGNLFTFDRQVFNFLTVLLLHVDEKEKNKLAKIFVEEVFSQTEINEFTLQSNITIFLNILYKEHAFSGKISDRSKDLTQRLVDVKQEIIN